MNLTEPVFPEVPLARGHYESYYLRAAAPDRPAAVWIRYTVHKDPGKAAVGSLWCTLFDADRGEPLAVKQTVPDPQAADWIRIAGHHFGLGSAVGAAEAQGHSGSWNLRFGGGSGELRHLPKAWMYTARLPRTKTLSPVCDARFEGSVELDGHRVDVEGWRGMVGHNWGAEHAERWVWIQGAAFEGRSAEDYFDMAVGRIKVAGMTTPWVGNAMLMLDGTPHRLGGFERIPSTEVEEEPTRCRFQLKGRDVRLTGSVEAPRKDFVAWIYADPVGPEHNTLNCSISDLRLDIELDGAPAQRLSVPGAAAYEFGTRDTDHGIPLQPYPDG